MDIIVNNKDSKLEIKLVGRLDTTTAPLLEDKIKAMIEGVTELVFNFESLEYISSAGLRIMLSTQKRMNQQGRMVIINMNSTVKEVFELTGFVDIIDIQ